MTNRGAVAGLRRTARIDLAALATNVTEALVAEPNVVLDARANAYGHGLVEVARVARECGVTTIRVSPREAAGLSQHRRSFIMTVPSVRPVIAAAAYGVDGRSPAVLTLTAEIVAVKRVPADAGVSYGYTYRTTEPTTLALIALGYADGVPRLASNRVSVLLSGVLRPLVGRVAMDQFIVDCGELTPSVGDDAILFGSAAVGAPTASDWARDTARSPLQLTAGLGSRIQRIYS